MATNQNTKREEVKKAMKDAFTTEQRITSDPKVDISSEDTCVKSYKELEALIRSDEKNILLNSSKQGYVLKHLKSSMKKGGLLLNASKTKKFPFLCHTVTF